jgi:hypothetical protein
VLKKLLILSIAITWSLTSCQNDDDQNLDINVTGKVINQNNIGVGDVTIYIQRGDLNSNYGPTNYNNYETIKTNSNGDYQYLVKNDRYSYKLCCEIPVGYTSVDEFCKFVNHTIINSQTVPNNINFKLEE